MFVETNKKAAVAQPTLLVVEINCGHHIGLGIPVNIEKYASCLGDKQRINPEI